MADESNVQFSEREALLFQDEVIPRSESALESARANWESGRGIFRRA